MNLVLSETLKHSAKFVKRFWWPGIVISRDDCKRCNNQKTGMLSIWLECATSKFRRIFRWISRKSHKHWNMWSGSLNLHSVGEEVAWCHINEVNLRAYTALMGIYFSNHLIHVLQETHPKWKDKKRTFEHQSWNFQRYTLMND